MVYTTHTVWWPCTFINVHCMVYKIRTVCMVYKTHTVWFIKTHCMVVSHIYKTHTLYGDSREENSPAAPAGTRTRDFSTTSPAL